MGTEHPPCGTDTLDTVQNTDRTKPCISVEIYNHTCVHVFVYISNDVLHGEERIIPATPRNQHEQQSTPEAKDNRKNNAEPAIYQTKDTKPQLVLVCVTCNRPTPYEYVYIYISISISACICHEMYHTWRPLLTMHSDDDHRMIAALDPVTFLAIVRAQVPHACPVVGGWHRYRPQWSQGAIRADPLH